MECGINPTSDNILSNGRGGETTFYIIFGFTLFAFIFHFGK